MIEYVDIIEKSMKDYLAGKLTGKELVKIVDDFVSSDQVYSLPESPREAILYLQDRIAFYVDNPLLRGEHESYFGDDELMRIITDFLRKHIQ